MTKLIAIEKNSGFIWGEAPAGTPLVDAATLIDQAAGSYDGREYEACSESELQRADGGFLFYSVPDDLVCDDGQSQTQIDAVCAHPIVGCVELVDVEASFPGRDGFDSTSFTIDDYAAAALAQYCEYADADVDDEDVVVALAHHVFHGFLEDDCSEETVEDLEKYFGAADAWCKAVGEFSDLKKERFLHIGRDLLSERLERAVAA